MSGRITDSQKGTILIVEDQESVLSGLKSYLALHGFDVLATTDADEALKISREHTGILHFLLMDICLPKALPWPTPNRQELELNGLELARYIMLFHPALKVTFLSALSEEDIQVLGGLPVGTLFLRKPVAGPELLATLTRLHPPVGSKR